MGFIFRAFKVLPPNTSTAVKDDDLFSAGPKVVVIPFRERGTRERDATKTLSRV